MEIIINYNKYKHQTIKCSLFSKPKKENYTIINQQ
jgi:hypothetical protein